MSRPAKETPAEKVARRSAAYERGWVDSLKAYSNSSAQSLADVYDYLKGWHDCSAYRWADPSNRGVAPDPTYRPHRRLAP